MSVCRGTPRRFAAVSTADPTADAESGFTLVELLVAVAIMGIIVALIMPMYLAANGIASTSQAMEKNDNALRPALVALSKEVNSASVLYSPKSSTAQTNTYVGPGFALLMYIPPISLQEGTTSLQKAGTCNQWRLFDTYVLEQRSWNPNTLPANSEVYWLTMASGVRNGPTQPAFALETTTGPGENVLMVKFDLVAQRTGSSSAESLSISTAIAAQGIQQSNTSTLCNHPPTTPSTQQ